MSKRKLIKVGALIIFAIIGWHLLSPSDRPQVVGSLASNDLRDVLQLVRQDLRDKVLPKVEWDNLFYPRYVVSSIGEYHAQRILWTEVHPDGEVEVFVGVSKERIHDEGYVWSLRKNPIWKITGYGYWGYSNVAPSGIHVPPSL
jgi:hypothetical protein